MKRCMRLLAISFALLSVASPSLAEDNRVYTYDIAGMVEEAKAYRGPTAEDSNVHSMVAKYIPLGRPKEEIFAALNGHDFAIHQTREKRYFGKENQHFDESYTASLYFWRFLNPFQYELRLVLFFDGGQLGKVRGYLFYHAL